MKREEDEEETTSSEEDDDYIPPPIPIEKRVRIIDPKEEAEARAAAALLAAQNIEQPSTSIATPSTSASQPEQYSASKDNISVAEQLSIEAAAIEIDVASRQEELSVAEQLSIEAAALEIDVASSQERDASPILSEDLQAPIEAGYSGTPLEESKIQDTTDDRSLSREDSLLGSEESESFDEILPPVFVEKKVRILDPKEEEELMLQRERRASVSATRIDVQGGSNETLFLLSYLSDHQYGQEDELLVQNLVDSEIFRKEYDEISQAGEEEGDKLSRKYGEQVQVTAGATLRKEDDKISQREEEEGDNLSRIYDDREFDEAAENIVRQQAISLSEKRVGFIAPLPTDIDSKLVSSAGTLRSFESQMSADRPARKNVSFYETADKDISKYKDSEGESQTGKQSLYSKYVERSASIMKDSRHSFQYDPSPVEVNTISSSDIFLEESQHSDDFTHGYRENKHYIIPPMTEHEIHRLGCNTFLEDVRKGGTEASCGDHIALGLAYMTVNGKRDLKETFDRIAKNMQSIGKTYSARMLGRYHEYARMFKYSGGNEGIVASMRYTSHCSDIIKSYIQLAALVEDPEEFTNVIMELAKRHAKLGLNLRDHQLHFRPFIEILGSTSDERMQVYSRSYFFVSLVSRAMLLAEQKMRVYSSSQDINIPVASSRSIIKSTKPKPELSRKQPIWD